jgi:hypothetical protein
MRAVAAAAVTLLAGCAAPAPAPASPERASGRIHVRVEFEPPLRAPGVLRYAHECGESRDVATSCTGVDVDLPPGPVTFQLQAEGGEAQLAASVAAGMAPIVWSWRP